jgi:putative SOS response-associated peptidase YedK
MPVAETHAFFNKFLDLLRPYDVEEMTAYPVDPLVGNVRNNVPELCKA